MESTDGAPAPRTRRRGRDLLDAIFRAARAELAEHGYARLTMEGVAARAGTGKAALYRRWTSKRDLVLDALDDALPAPTAPAGAALRDALVGLLGAFGDVLAGRTAFPGGAVLAEVLLEPELAARFRQRLVESTLDPIRVAIERAVGRSAAGQVGEQAAGGRVGERGESSPVVEHAARTGPALVLQTFLLTGAAPARRELEEIVDLVVLPLLQATRSKDTLQYMSPRPAGPPEWSAFPHHRHRDPGALRAIAHPVRMRLLEMLAIGGPATASELAERLGESPANTSWHLRQLAKYGYLEPAGGGRGRERPWRYVPRSYSHGTSDETGELAAASDAAALLMAEHEFGLLRRWEVRRRAAPTEWQDAAFVSQTLAWLTPAELAELGRRINELFQQGGHVERILEPARRPPDGRVTRLFAWGFPGED